MVRNATTCGTECIECLGARAEDKDGVWARPLYFVCFLVRSAEAWETAAFAE